jgi:hypothetical protein
MSSDRPECHGKFWDRSAVECEGGLDPAYEDGRAGTIQRTCATEGREATTAEQEILNKRNLRPRCDFYSSCAAKQQLSKFQGERHKAEVATQQHVHVAPPQRQVTVPTHVTQQMQVQPQQMQPGYQQMMPVNYQMPAYLTVPEQRTNGQSMFNLLGREIFRGMGKSLGHTVAHFFDQNPTRYPK